MHFEIDTTDSKRIGAYFGIALVTTGLFQLTTDFPTLDLFPVSTVLIPCFIIGATVASLPAEISRFRAGKRLLAAALLSLTPTAIDVFALFPADPFVVVWMGLAVSIGVVLPSLVACTTARAAAGRLGIPGGAA